MIKVKLWMQKTEIYEYIAKCVLKQFDDSIRKIIMCIILYTIFMISVYGARYSISIPQQKILILMFGIFTGVYIYKHISRLIDLLPAKRVIRRYPVYKNEYYVDNVICKNTEELEIAIKHFGNIGLKIIRHTEENYYED